MFKNSGVSRMRHYGADSIRALKKKYYIKTSEALEIIAADNEWRRNGQREAAALRVELLKQMKKF